MSPSAPRANSIACLVSFVILISVAPVDALSQPWTGGIRIGTSVATFSGQSDTDWGYTAALAGGGSVSYWFTEVMSVRTEILYAQRGATTSDAIVNGLQTGFEADVSITYVDIPILLSARLPLSAAVVPSVFAGGAYGANIETLLSLTDDNGVVVSNSDPSIANNDLFGVFGFALDFDVAGQRVVFDARASLGLTNIRPDRPDSPLRNTSYLFTVGLDF